MKCILLFLAVLSCGPMPAAAGNPFLRTEEQAPFVVAHGGCKHLFPENTMVAFDGAVALGVDMLEMDVRLTADSVLVTHHDDTLRRTSDGEGPIIGYTLEELGRFNFGAKFAGLEKSYPYRDRKVRITTLEEVLLKYGAMKRMFLEIKGEGEEGCAVPKNWRNCSVGPQRRIACWFRPSTTGLSGISGKFRRDAYKRPWDAGISGVLWC